MKKSRQILKWKRKLRANRTVLVGIAAVSGILLVACMNAKNAELEPIAPAKYRPILDTIAKGESKGNYNAYYGHANNSKIKFTKMSVGEVMQWQERYVQDGSVSSAVGRYQIIRPTLSGLMRQLDIKSHETFDVAMQDRMAIALLERRGAREFAANKITREQFAANLAKEWAALPKVLGPNPHESHYAHDGINKSRITITELFASLAKLV
jgi:muramidase (phage lysozyme)